MKYVAVQPDDTGIFLVPDFADLADAQDFATTKGIGGTVTEVSVYSILPFNVARALSQAKADKLSELMLEGNRRSELVNSHFLSVIEGYVLGITVNAQTPLGNSWTAVSVAWNDARGAIGALPDLPSVLAYDVVTDPVWP